MKRACILLQRERIHRQGRGAAEDRHPRSRGHGAGRAGAAHPARVRHRFGDHLRPGASGSWSRSCGASSRSWRTSPASASATRTTRCWSRSSSAPTWSSPPIRRCTTTASPTGPCRASSSSWARTSRWHEHAVPVPGQPGDRGAASPSWRRRTRSQARIKKAISDLDKELAGSERTPRSGQVHSRAPAAAAQGLLLSGSAYQQLEMALKRISHLLALDEQNQEDTALLIQPMVYGNYGKDSASGQFFTRNIVTGERRLQGEFFQESSTPSARAGQDINSSPRPT